MFVNCRIFRSESVEAARGEIAGATLRAHLEGFSDLQIGAVGSFYYAGFVAGCFIVPKLLARVGHIRTFAVAASLTAATILLLPILTSPIAWFVDRAKQAQLVGLAGMGTQSESQVFSVFRSNLQALADAHRSGE